MSNPAPRRIESKADLEYFLACDRIGLRLPEGRRRPRPVLDQVWEYEILLRKVEYHTNVRTPLGRVLLPYYKLRYHRLGSKLGLLIPPNVFGPGLSIAHFGCTIVNANARVGANCRIHEGVTLGANHGKSLAPQLGNNCFIGSGAKIIGDVHLGDNVAVGAGAVVTRSFPESDITLGGVPARIISRNDSSAYVVDATGEYARGR